MAVTGPFTVRFYSDNTKKVVRKVEENFATLGEVNGRVQSMKELEPTWVPHCTDANGNDVVLHSDVVGGRK